MIQLVASLLRQDGQPADEGMLRRMAEAMPVDDLDLEYSLKTDGPAGLVLIRLTRKNSLPVAGDAFAPLEIYDDGRLIISADLRLYNRAELEKTFGPQETDVHFIARLYETQGKRGLDRLEGDFTIALWDRQSGQMVMKRDHVGVRPAYYAQEPGKGVLFSSLGKGVRAAGLIKTPINKQAQFDHLSHDPSDQVGTFHHNMYRLPGGHEAVATVSSFDIHEYWRLKAIPLLPESVTFEDWVAELKDIFRRAVTKRLPEKGPIGSHLSSGMDSASISAIAAENLKHDDQVLDSYTFAMSEEFTEEDMLDEVPYAKKVAMARNRISWNRIHVKYDYTTKPIAFEEDRDHKIGPNDLELQAASDFSGKGGSVILSGWGGDEIATYTGTGALAELLVKGKFSTFAHEVKMYSKRREQSVTRVLYAVVGARFLPQSVLDFAKDVTGFRNFKEAKRRRSGFKNSIATKYDRPLRRGPNSQKNRIEKFYNGNLHWRLEEWAYKGYRHAVQYAFPMLDLELINHCLACPPEFLLRDGYNRAGFRAAMRGVLPDEILTNRWKHIAAPCSNIEVIRRKDALLAELDELEKNAQLREIFDFAAIRKRLHDLPTEEEERKRLAYWATKGEQGYNLGNGIVSPIASMKRFLELKAEEEQSSEAD